MQVQLAFTCREAAEEGVLAREIRAPQPPYTTPDCRNSAISSAE